MGWYENNFLNGTLNGREDRILNGISGLTSFVIKVHQLAFENLLYDTNLPLEELFSSAGVTPPAIPFSRNVESPGSNLLIWQ